MKQYNLVQNNSIPKATDGYHPSPTTYDQKAVEEFCEKLKLENLGYKQRCEQLEQLCRDMYLGASHYYITSELLERAWRDDFEDSMFDLGLLEVDK